MIHEPIHSAEIPVIVFSHLMSRVWFFLFPPSCINTIRLLSVSGVFTFFPLILLLEDVHLVHNGGSSEGCIWGIPLPVICTMGGERARTYLFEEETACEVGWWTLLFIWWSGGRSSLNFWRGNCVLGRGFLLSITLTLSICALSLSQFCFHRSTDLLL